MFKWLGTFYSFLFVIGLLSPISAADVDNSPPELLSASFSGSKIDNSSGANTVAMHYQVADKGMGLHAMTIRLRGIGENARTYTQQVSFSGEKSATGKVFLILPAATPPGKYEVSMSISDRSGHVTPFLMEDVHSFIVLDRDRKLTIPQPQMISATTNACRNPPIGMTFWLSPNPEPVDRITGVQGTWTGAAAMTAGPHGGDAIQLTETNSILYPDHLGNFGESDFTIDFWVKISPIQGWYGVIPFADKRDGANGFMVFNYKNVLHLQIADGGHMNISSGVNLTDGKWRFVAISVDRDNAQGGKIYIDGNLVKIFDPTPYNNSMSNDAPLTIGYSAKDNTRRGVYSIDEMEFYDRALSDLEIADLYTAPKCGAGDPPLNTPPIAVDDVITATAGEMVIVNVLENDSDPDINDVLSVVSASADNGQTAVNSDGTISYTSEIGFAGDVEIAYKIRDTAGATSTAIATVKILSTPIDYDNDGYSEDVDCNDNNANIHPDASDNTPDGIDNNCDGKIDEGWPLTNCADERHDLEFSTQSLLDVSNVQTVCVCAANASGCPAISTQNCLDSTATQAGKLPRILNLPDGTGQVCVYSKGSVSHPATGSPGAFWAQRITNPDLDGDGHSDDVDCNDGDANIYPGAPDNTFDDLDNDCDGDIDEDANNAPLANDINVTINENETMTVDVIADGHASDADDDMLSVAITTQPQTGTVSASGSVVSFTPAANDTSTKSFKYTVTDPDGASATAWINVQIKPMGNPPDFSVTKTLRSCQSFGPGAASCVYDILIENNGAPYSGDIQVEDLTNQKVNQFSLFDENNKPVSCQVFSDPNPSPLTFSAGTITSGRFDICTIDNANIDSSTPILLTAMMKLGGPAQWPPTGDPLNCAVVIMWDGRPSGMETSDFPSSCIDALTFPPGGVFRNCDACPEMVVIPSGSFTMGSPASEAGRRSDEGPQQTVQIDYQFAVGKYEVTWAEWSACVADGGCAGYSPSDMGWGKDSRPVINVSWDDAQAYVDWLSDETGEDYRLLSEAEWEYVARAGTTSAYWWGNMVSRENANYGADQCCSGLSNGFASGNDQWEYTSPAGSFPANAFGLHDLHGNLWEWVEDCYVNSYSGAPTDGSARIANPCSRRVTRGGSWTDDGPRPIRSANRFKFYHTNRNIYIGFRVAKSLLSTSP